MKDDGVYLTHILESIERVEQYTASGKGAFFEGSKVQAPTSQLPASFYLPGASRGTRSRSTSLPTVS